MRYLTGGIIGFFIGGVFGFMAAALCAASGAVSKIEEMNYHYDGE